MATSVEGSNPSLSVSRLNQASPNPPSITVGGFVVEGSQSLSVVFPDPQSAVLNSRHRSGSKASSPAQGWPSLKATNRNDDWSGSSTKAAS